MPSSITRSDATEIEKHKLPSVGEGITDPTEFGSGYNLVGMTFGAYEEEFNLTSCMISLLASPALRRMSFARRALGEGGHGHRSRA